MFSTKFIPFYSILPKKACKDTIFFAIMQISVFKNAFFLRKHAIYLHISKKSCIFARFLVL